jgi:hypothetical protein
MESPQQALVCAYRAILSDVPKHWLDQSRVEDPVYSKLSGLFLPGTSDAYLNAHNRILVVGRETRAWNVVSSYAPFVDLDDYIQRAMTKQQSFLSKALELPPDKGESFFNFLRALAPDHGKESIAWANLFSLSWNGKSPMQWEHFHELRKISERLLKTQIEILEPDVIVFANGASSARYRRVYFPHKGESSVCSRLADYRDEGVPIGQLWRFHLYDSISCFRIQHPSSISVGARAARQRLLEELRSSPPARAKCEAPDPSL